MTYIFIAAGVMVTYTLLRVVGNELEQLKRQREAEDAAKAIAAQAAAAEAALEATFIAKSPIKMTPPKPASAPPAVVAAQPAQAAAAKKAA